MPQQPLARVPADMRWHWQEEGACRQADPSLFFHPQNERGSMRAKRDRAAKQVCATCPVRIDCADYAVRAREPYGIWGGLSEEERSAVFPRLARQHLERGEGARAAADEIAEAVSPESLSGFRPFSFGPP